MSKPKPLDQKQFDENLRQFADRVLDVLEQSHNWDADVLDKIDTLARDLSLAKVDSGCHFRRTHPDPAPLGYAIAPEGTTRKYLTPGKAYPITCRAKHAFWIDDDNGSYTVCLYQNCAHLGLGKEGQWVIVERVENPGLLS